MNSSERTQAGGIWNESENAGSIIVPSLSHNRVVMCAHRLAAAKRFPERNVPVANRRISPTVDEQYDLTEVAVSAIPLRWHRPDFSECSSVDLRGEGSRQRFSKEVQLAWSATAAGQTSSVVFVDVQIDDLTQWWQ